MSDESKESCITPDCGKPRSWKGLCRSCHGVARNLIDSQQVTGWDELAEMGLVIPEGKPFKVAFLKRKAEQQRENNEDQTRGKGAKI